MIICVYDRVKLNEPKFLAPIRAWEKRMNFVTPIIWRSAIILITFHIIAFIWTFKNIFVTPNAKWQTILFSFIYGELGGFGVTAGAHRLWSHRSYKAKTPLKLFLIFCYSIAGQNTIYAWVRDHRVHHKFTETSADPHDASRGFFFSHVGWLMMKKHPDVIREGNKIDMSDITDDPFLKLHIKYFSWFRALFCWILPSLVPALLWAETWRISILSQILSRYAIILNNTWSVNSISHIWGNKPYDVHINSTDNWKVSVVTLGEGWHNYHHTFPWDYKAPELAYHLNPTTRLIDMFAKIGWAYDLKTPSSSMIQEVVKRRGPKDKQL